MPLKDHRQELWCASAIAGLVKHQAKAKKASSARVGAALKALAAKKHQEELDLQNEMSDVLLDLGIVQWGTW